MREIELRFVTEVTDIRTSRRLIYPRMSESWCRDMEANGYIVINTEREYPTQREENYL